MPLISTDQGVVHYEVYGRGRPIILIHGWLGSWGLWQETMAYLGKFYRTYALDFWGVGDSGKNHNSYAVQDFVGVVNQFMDLLGIEQAALIGHSMGGTVGLSVAIQYPQRVSKVAVVGSPIKGSSLTLPLKLMGGRGVAKLLVNAMWATKLGIQSASPLICRDPNFPRLMERGLSKTLLESFLQSIGSLRRINLTSSLSMIKVPAMGMYGSRDRIVHPKQWKLLVAGIPQTRVERFAHAGHFIMMDEPDHFILILKDFLDQNYNEL
jgi:pimeloyl-ACP methyl ester carboxylesterase